MVVYIKYMELTPYLYDDLSLEECIVVLNMNGIVLRKRKAEKQIQTDLFVGGGR